MVEEHGPSNTRMDSSCQSCNGTTFHHTLWKPTHTSDVPTPYQTLVRQISTAGNKVQGQNSTFSCFEEKGVTKVEPSFRFCMV